MTRNEWAQVAARIRAAYPGSSFDARAEAVYLDVLEDVDVRAVDRAVEELLKEGHPDPPAAGVIRSRALGGEPAAPPARPVEVRDHGARRGVGWLGVVAAAALVAAAIALILILVDENGDGETMTTTPSVTVTQTSPTTVTTPTETVTQPTVEVPVDPLPPPVTTP